MNDDDTPMDPLTSLAIEMLVNGPPDDDPYELRGDPNEQNESSDYEPY